MEVEMEGKRSAKPIRYTRLIKLATKFSEEVEE